MTPLVSLWLPILLSAVGVFLASSVLHMFTGWHKSDYLKVPNEDRVMDTLRPLAIPPGDYMMPRPHLLGALRSGHHVVAGRDGERTERVHHPIFVRHLEVIAFVPAREHVKHGA